MVPPKTSQAVLADALRLETTERAELAAELIASLDGPPDENVEAAWALELERRVTMIDTGAAKLEPWSEAKRRIEREYSTRDAPGLESSIPAVGGPSA